MNYTINEIPDTAEEANNTDYAIMWQDKTKKISISNLFKKLVKKSEVTNTISPINENPVTSKAVSSLLTISASTTTITDAPPLQNGIALRIFFTSEITGTDNTTVLQITYNGTVYNVKVPKDGALQNYVAFEVSSGVFKYLQAYTTLELLFDGTQFVIVGNPVVLSGSNYLYYADGSHNTNTVASGNMQSVTSNAVKNVLPFDELNIFDDTYYPSNFRFTVSNNFKGKIRVEVFNSNNTSVGSLDCIFYPGNILIKERNTINYDLASNSLTLYLPSSANCKHYIHADILQGHIVSADYI